MTKETAIARIEGKEKAIAKLEKKVERIEKAKATNWEVNPYYYDESDLRRALREIEEEKEKLEDYKRQLVVIEEKENSRNVPAITEFLDGWEKRMTDFYMKGIDIYYEELQKVRSAFHENYEKGCEMSHVLHERVHGRYEKVPYINKFGKTSYYSEKVEDGDLEIYAEYLQFRNRDEAVARLEKDLKVEYDRKYDFIIERTNAIVKTITDASNLRVGAKGDLNGFIIGTDGTAKVQTIGAGGYNIQCFHFRTLINAMK